MKKFTLLLSILFLCSCSSKDPITKYVKEDIVIEVGDKVELKNIIETDKIKDDKLKAALEKAKINLNLDENNIKAIDEVKDDKIFASNKVHVEYNYKDKDYKSDIDIQLKDTKKPKVELNNNYYFALVNNPKSKADFIKSLNLKVTDNGKYNIDIKDFDKVDFSKVQENKLKLVIKDEANNVITKDITLFIGKEAKKFVIDVSFPEFGIIAKKLIITVPSNVTSYYNVSEKNSNGQKSIILKNGSEQIQITFPIPYAIGFTGYDYIDEYKINNFHVTTMTASKYNIDNGKKNKSYTGKVELVSVYSTKYSGVGFVSSYVNSNNNDNLKWVIDSIVSNAIIE